MTRENEILQFLHYHPDSSRSEIETGMNLTESHATVKRILAALVETGSAIVSGQGRATRYSVSPQAHVTMELNIDTYFQKETDERERFRLVSTLSLSTIFSLKWNYSRPRRKIVLPPCKPSSLAIWRVSLQTNTAKRWSVWALT